MTVIENLVEQVKNLPIERQREVLDFVEFLNHKEKSNGGKPLKSLEGMWKDVDISREDIDEARREMWGNFPSKDI